MAGELTGLGIDSAGRRGSVALLAEMRAVAADGTVRQVRIRPVDEAALPRDLDAAAGLVEETEPAVPTGRDPPEYQGRRPHRDRSCGRAGRDRGRCRCGHSRHGLARSGAGGSGSGATNGRWSSRFWARPCWRSLSAGQCPGGSPCRSSASRRRPAGYIMGRLDERFGRGGARELDRLGFFLERHDAANSRGGGTRVREAEKRATLGELARQVNHDVRNGLVPIRNVMSHLADAHRGGPGGAGRRLCEARSLDRGGEPRLPWQTWRTSIGPLPCTARRSARICARSSLAVIEANQALAPDRAVGRRSGR